MKKNNKRMELIGLLLGNAIEFYDFTVYAFMAPFIKKNIFPLQDNLNGFLLIFSIFSSGYFVRPFGSIIFGHIGDKYSRDSALILSVGLATLSTLGISFVPSYEVIGGYSVYVLLILRMAQGLSVSGEEGGATVRIYETLFPNNRGLASSLVISTIFLGVLLGSIVCYGVSTLIENETVSEYFWRVPFLLALPIGYVTLHIRLQNTKIKQIKGDRVDIPIKLLMNKAGMLDLLSCYSVGVFFSIMTAVLFVYVPYFCESAIFTSPKDTLYIVSFGIFLSILLAPLFGYISDVFTEKSVLKFGVIISTVFMLLLFPLLRYSYRAGLVLLFLTYASMAMLVPATFSLMLDVFDEYVRYTGMSLALNMAIATFSGALPVVLIYLTQKSDWAPGGLIAAFLMLFYLIYFLTVKFKDSWGSI